MRTGTGRLLVVRALALRAFSSAIAALAATLAFPVAPLAAQEPGSAVRTTWSYAGDTGPEHWGELYDAFATCVMGARQSPIDLTGATANDLPDPSPLYRLTPGKRVGTQGSMLLRLEAGSAVEIDGHRYELLQVHAHSPSEHTIDGRRFPAEVHLVHQHASGQLAVLAVMLDEGAENPDLQPLMPPFPADAQEQPLAAPVAALSLLPASLATYRYEGSLTTPPCTEGVRWLVLATPLPASPAQLTALADALESNSRPVQARGNRELYLDAQ